MERASHAQDWGADHIFDRRAHTIHSHRLASLHLTVVPIARNNDSLFRALIITARRTVLDVQRPTLTNPMQWRRAIAQRLLKDGTVPPAEARAHATVGSFPTRAGVQAAADVAGSHILLFSPASQMPEVFTPAQLDLAQEPICLQWVNPSQQGRRTVCTWLY